MNLTHEAAGNVKQSHHDSKFMLCVGYLYGLSRPSEFHPHFCQCPRSSRIRTEACAVPPEIVGGSVEHSSHWSESSRKLQSTGNEVCRHIMSAMPPINISSNIARFCCGCFDISFFLFDSLTDILLNVHSNANDLWKYKGSEVYNR